MKLSKAQIKFLSLAADNPRDLINPDDYYLTGNARDTVIHWLLKKEAITPHDDWYRVTQKGLEAVFGLPDEGKQASAEPQQIPPTAATQEEPTKSVKVRPGTKQAKVIEMLQRPEGATIAQIYEQVCWQHHTIRGSLHGVLKKRLGFTITSEKMDDGDRIYRIA